MVTFKELFKNNISLWIIILTPIIAMPLPIAVNTKAGYCGYCLIIIVVYWITECLPLAVTSLLPVFLFPMFAILDSKTTSKIYFEDINMLFFGGLVMALAVEKTNLHQRIALGAIMLVGTNPLWLLLGIMAITGFLSLWISNTATASMMLPIVIEIVKQLIKTDKRLLQADTNKVSDVSLEMPHEMERQPENIEMEAVASQDEIVEEKPREAPQVEEIDDKNILATKQAKDLMTGFCLSITYSAGIGGTGSLVGTTPNLLLKGHYDEYYPSAGLSFLTYMIFTLPAAVILVLIAWVLLAFQWLPRRYLLGIFDCFKSKKNKEKKDDTLKNIIKQKYADLGPFNWEQKSVLGMFIVLVLLWICRDLYFVPGWGYLFQKNETDIYCKNFLNLYVSDTTPSILAVIFLVAWPKRNIFKGHKYEHLLDWQTINSEFPWYIILLGGGGLAIAEGFKSSKLSDWMGDIVKKIVPADKNATLLIIMLFSLVFTEVLSNTTTESILLSVVDSLAVKNNINPSFFLLPLTISVSLAFILPIATSTNTVVYTSGYITVKDMLKSGLILKILGIGVVFLSANTWLGAIFPAPEEFLQASSNSSNFTAVCSLNYTLIKLTKGEIYFDKNYLLGY